MSQPARDDDVTRHPVEQHACLASTSAEARARVEAGAAPDGLVIVADIQTAGHGRRGRRWHAPPGRSLAATVVLAPPPLERPTRLTVLAAVAACRALESLGTLEPRIKWPNDLMRDDRKIGGILVESARAPDGSPRQLLGLGVNLELRPGDLPPGIADLAGDAGLRGDKATRDALLEAFLRELDAALAELRTPGDLARGAEYRRRSWLTGRRVEIASDGRRFATSIADVTADGDLILEDGSLLRGESTQLLSVEGRGEAR